MTQLSVGFAMSGSFCTFDRVLMQVKELVGMGMEVTPILSFNASTLDTRFGKAEDFRRRLIELTGRDPMTTLTDVEPIGPKVLFDVLVVAPCTGTTLGRLANGLSDSPVSLAVKSHLRRSRPVVLAVSTNDGLSGSAANLGTLLNRRHYYFVPLRQDAPHSKPRSLVADMTLIPAAIDAAMNGRQLQPILLAPSV